MPECARWGVRLLCRSVRVGAYASCASAPRCVELTYRQKSRGAWAFVDTIWLSGAEWPAVLRIGMGVGIGIGPDPGPFGTAGRTRSVDEAIGLFS